MVNSCEALLDFKTLPKDQLFDPLCVKLEPATVYEKSYVNPEEKNANNCCRVLFAHCQRRDHKEAAVLNILHGILKEPFFNQLRTQEQLGYIVQCSQQSIGHMLHLTFLVQSSHKDPDFLESRINAFLEAHRAILPTQEQVDKLKQAAIAELSQKPKSLYEEMNRNWNFILDEYDFDHREKVIKLLE